MKLIIYDCQQFLLFKKKQRNLLNINCVPKSTVSNISLGPKNEETVNLGSHDVRVIVKITTKITKIAPTFRVKFSMLPRYGSYMPNTTIRSPPILSNQSPPHIHHESTVSHGRSVSCPRMWRKKTTQLMSIKFIFHRLNFMSARDKR